MRFRVHLPYIGLPQQRRRQESEVGWMVAAQPLNISPVTILRRSNHGGIVHQLSYEFNIVDSGRPEW